MTTDGLIIKLKQYFAKKNRLIFHKIKNIYIKEQSQESVILENSSSDSIYVQIEQKKHLWL